MKKLSGSHPISFFVFFVTTVAVSLFASPFDPTLSFAKDKKMPSGSITLARDKLKAVCNGINKDLRLESFLTILDRLIEPDPTCPQCKTFFANFKASCKLEPGKKSKKSQLKKQAEAPIDEAKKEEPAAPTAEGTESEAGPVPTLVPTPAPPVPEREPNVPLLSLVSIIFEDFAEDKKFWPYRAPLIRKLLLFMTNGDGKTPGEKDYYQILAAFIRDPFKEALHAPIEVPQDADASSAADSMFE